MALLDLKSSLSNFVLSTSRSPRIVHPFLWDEAHFEAFGITDESVSFENVDADRRSSHLVEGKLLNGDDQVSKRRLTAFTSEVAHVLSELASGNGSVAAGFLLHYLRSSWTRGEGQRSPFVPQTQNPQGGHWDLECRDSVYNHTPVQRFTCYGWQTYLQTDDITVLTNDLHKASEQSRSPPVMATVTSTNMHWYWETYVNRKEKQRESIFKRLKRDVERRREERRRLLPRKIADLEPTVLAVLIGMAQEQRATFPGRGTYSCHFAYPFADENAINPSVSMVFISARFSDSYLRTLEFDPRSSSSSPQTSTATPHSSPSFSQPQSPAMQRPANASDLIDVKVRIFRDVMTRASALDSATQRCKDLLQFVGSEMSRSVDDLVGSRPTNHVESGERVIPILRMDTGKDTDPENALSRKRRALSGTDNAGCSDFRVQEKMSLKKLCT